MPEPQLFFVFLLIATYLSVIVHEAGHALIGMALGFVVTSVGLGTARPLLIIPMGRTRLYLNLSQPFQGITFAFLPRPHSDRRRMAAFVSGGIAANALFAAASYSLTLCLPTGRFSAFFSVFAAINAFMATLSVIPLHFRVGQVFLRSDGRLLLDTLRTGSFAQSPADVIQTAQGCRRLWQAVGDGLMDRLFTLSAALSWIDLGSYAKADLLFTEATGIEAAHPYIDWLEAVTRANLAMAKDELPEACAALTQAESSYGPSSGVGGHYLVAVLRANLLFCRGRQNEALEAFERLSADPVSRTFPELGMSALAGHLRAACVFGDQAAISSLQDDYEAMRRSHPSDVRDLQVYGALARYASSRGADAREDFRRALKSIALLAAPFRDEDEKAAFLEAQRGLIEEARQALGAESAAQFLKAIETHQPDVPPLILDRPWRKWALRLMLINAVSFVAFAPLGLALKPSGLPILVLAVFLALFTLLGAIWLLLDFAVGRFLTSIKRLSGAILLTMAVMPWIGGLLCCVTSTIMP